jgi:hypothetical protein
VAGWYRADDDPQEIGRRVLAGRRPHPWSGLDGGRRLVVAWDIDTDAGVAAVVWHGRDARSREPVQHVGLYERGEQQWLWLGGGQRK